MYTQPVPLCDCRPEEEPSICECASVCLCALGLSIFARTGFWLCRISISLTNVLGKWGFSGPWATTSAGCREGEDLVPRVKVRIGFLAIESGVDGAEGRHYINDCPPKDRSASE